ncbi:MAG: hypothetical protein M0Q93_11845 [Terrimicrobiaceae bacterium]|nr:hypothetical protein [Terrimicrobiaceae bacterium]
MYNNINLSIMNIRNSLFFFLALIACSICSADEVAPHGTLSFSKTLYKAIQSLPTPYKEYLQVDSGGSMTNLSATQWYTIKLQGQSKDEFLKKYFHSIYEYLTKRGISSGEQPCVGNANGLRSFSLESSDKRITGTIAITIYSLSDDQIVLLVATATSPSS